MEAVPALPTTRVIPRPIVDSFTRALGENHESALYAPWNALLNFLFPQWMEVGGMHFEITPQKATPTPDSLRAAMDFELVVSNGQEVFLVVEAKPQAHLRNISSREMADIQMRDRLRAHFDPGSKAPLHGISAIGNMICHFSIIDGLIAPKRIINNGDRADFDAAPVDRWALDLVASPTNLMDLLLRIRSEVLHAYGIEG
eukprot:TRINITY_DN17576_c0_g1_i1.p1 TRINITY_DN17576_c0_g1~~TRINITY_DN17576_c0_g1_i1.p1  ORF type:complete len:200 (+),score=19.79 TRINITY_DN17576_c0_g1_i1:64-663(+)